MIRFNRVLLPACALVLTSGLACTQAQAVPADRVFVSNAPGLCQAALPAFEGSIRKRPLAVQNEGTSTAFVTCAFTSQGGGVTNARIWTHSMDGLPHTLSCTGVAGYNGSSVAVTKTITIAASGQTRVEWLGSDFPGAPAAFPGLGRFSASCAMEPNVGLDDLTIAFTEDIG